VLLSTANLRTPAYQLNGVYSFFYKDVSNNIVSAYSKSQTIITNGAIAGQYQLQFPNVSINALSLPVVIPIYGTIYIRYTNRY
jgi:hypothetical protein